MKVKIQITLTVALLLLISTSNFAQTINLGTAANFVLFSSTGALTNTGSSQLTGNVGTNNGSSTGFGNVNGQMHDNDLVSAQAATDLLVAYNQLNNATPTLFPASLLGNGQTLSPGIYSISAATTLNLDLTLNANNNPNAVFIFKIKGSFSANANANVKLTNGAQACNVYWKIEGLVSLASSTIMRGNVIANNAAITMGSKVTLEGRALTTAGAISTNNVLAYTPIGCGSSALTGPAAPNLASTACYGLFTGNGSLTNTGNTHVMGDVGTNVGLTTGFNALWVTGSIHPIPDGSTAQCAADLGNLATYLDTLPTDIELLYPAQFGRNLVLTPHTYIMNAGTTFTDTLYLNALGDSNAVFVIKINGAFGTSTHSKVILMNQAKARNVFWAINGAVDISDSSDFSGTIVCNNAAVNISIGTTINGRVYTTNGAFTTASITTTMAPNCTLTSIPENEKVEVATVYPNPFTTQINVSLSSLKNNQYEWRLYSVLGAEVMNAVIVNSNTTIAINKLPSGIYFYQLLDGNVVIQSGKLISQQ